MRNCVLINLAVLAEGIRLQAGQTPLQGNRCVTDPQGEWRQADANKLVDEYLQNKQAFPDLCMGASPEKDYDYAPCKQAMYAQNFVSDCLDPFDAEAFVKSIENKTMSLIGDSMMAQLYDRISCSMASVAHLVKSVSRDPGNPPLPDWGFFRIDFQNGAALQFQYVDRSLKWMTRYKIGKGPGQPWHYNTTAWDADFFILNIGAWQKEWGKLEEHLDEIHTAISERRRPGSRLIFREYYPTHFPVNTSMSKNYDFSRGAKGLVEEEINEPWTPRQRAGIARHWEMSAPCTSRSIEPSSGDQKRLYGGDSFNSSLEMEMMRLDNATKHMQDKGWEVLRTFDLALPQFAMHPGVSDDKPVDCRHWCQPSPVLDATKMILANMVKQPPPMSYSEASVK